MSNICPTCGAAVQDNYRFCSNCGAVLPRDLASSTGGQQGVPQPPEGQSTDSPVTYVVQRWEPPSPAGPSGASGGTPASAVGGDESPAPFVPPDFTGTQAGPAQSVSSTPTAPTAPTIPVPPLSTPSPVPATAAASGQTTPLSGRGPAEFTPGMAAHRQEATYVRYTGTSAAELDRTAPPRSWLLPAIIVASVLLLALGAVAGYLAVTNRWNLAFAPVHPAAPTATAVQLPTSGSEEDRVRETVRISNELQIRAWRELNPDLLKQTYSGQVLAENLNIIQQLKSQNMYAVPENLRLDILDVRVQGNQAIVHTVEEWKVSYYRSSDNKLVDTKGPDVLSETYYMVKRDGNWYIDRIEFQEGQPPQF